MSARHYRVDATLDKPQTSYCLKVGPAIVQIKHEDESVVIDVWPDREDGDQDGTGVWVEFADLEYGGEDDEEDAQEVTLL